MKHTKRIDPSHATTALELAALNWLNNKGESYDNGAEGAHKDLLYGGCQSGIVGYLVYRDDCLVFAQKHLGDILDILADLEESTGEMPRPDASRGYSLNADWLAWTGFELAAQRVAERAGIES